jgi:8-amino-3,8-dideoxy-alpha-D-manno-octulosonate transaminase
MKVDWPSEFPGVYWLDKKEEQAVLDVLQSRSPFRYYGLQTPVHVSRLEERAKEFYGVKYALAVNSGSGALMIAMSALGIGPGCEVIVPTYLWPATVSAAVCHNAIPVLCEVDESFTLDPADLEDKITPRTKLILPVHMSGAAAAMGQIMEVAQRHQIAVLEDCAQANGGTFQGKKLGTFGAIGIYSFQMNKNATAGEGGLIVTDDEQLYLKALAAHDLGVPWINNLPDADCGVALWGQGRRMSELCGAVANVQLEKLSEIVKHMRRSKQRIKSMLADVDGLGFRRLNDVQGDCGPFMILVLDNKAKAVAVCEHMKQAGLHNAVRLTDYGLHIYYNIPSLVQKTPLSAAGNPWSLPQNSESVYNYNKGVCPQSDALFARSILLPIPSRLTDSQEEAAARIIQEAMAEITACTEK